MLFIRSSGSFYRNTTLISVVSYLVTLKMNSFISVSSLVVVFSLVIDANGWVFTDVDFDKLMEMQGKSLFEDEESGVSPSGEMDVAQLKLSLIYPGKVSFLFI